MGMGTVNVHTQNLKQGRIPGVERHFLFIGAASKNTGLVHELDQDSDIDDLLGTGHLVDNLLAARLNGDANWSASAIGVANANEVDGAIDVAMEQDIDPEMIIITYPVANAGELNDLQAKAVEIENSHKQRVIILTCVAGIDNATQSWAEYLAEVKPIVDGVAAFRVGVVPNLHGNNLGVLAGRLSNRIASIADSPMRVKTGALVGLGAPPLDKDSKPLPDATLGALDKERFSVPQRYKGYEGMYWADGNLLDTVGGDYQVIENLRVMDKAARAVRILLIGKVADRSLNSTPISIATHERIFTKPLRAMATTVNVAGETLPGEIKPPGDDAVTIQWKTRTEVEVYLNLTPYHCPKTLTANLALKLGE